MKKVFYALSVAAAVAGCNVKEPTEAEIFGYKGQDIENPESKNFIVTAPAVTNWVPERVLSVIEKYDYSDAEKKLVNDFGVLLPSASHKTMPEGYERDSNEPWFVYWVKKSTQGFGFSGVAGVLSHFNEDLGEWQTSGTYFSSYWKTEEEARATLNAIKEKIAAEYSVKKFHPIATGWVAEYLRLCVMGVVGQKADGSWACMIDFRDKCNYGCGPWESVPEQQERLNRYVYQKEMKVWRKTLADIISKNHKAIEAKMSERGNSGFADTSGPMQRDDYRNEYSKIADLEGLVQTNDLAVVMSSVWSEKLSEVTKALGGAFEGEPTEESNDDFFVKTAQWESDLHSIRLDVVVGKQMVSSEPPAEEAASQEQEKPAEAESEKAAPKFEIVGRWRVVFCEKFITGEKIPEKPVLK